MDFVMTSGWFLRVVVQQVVGLSSIGMKEARLAAHESHMA